MTERQRKIIANAEKNKQMVLEAERFIWRHPETGFNEWETSRYLTEKFEALHYTLVQAGDIPGFYTDIDTGIPGPTLAIMGEMDALDIGGHPEAVNGNSHACGHNAQSAAMLGVAAALKEEGALTGLSGKIRLLLVPAEEMIQLSYREELRKKGILHYYGGKPEFMYRGFFDGVDLAIMVHGTADRPGKVYDFTCGPGNNGCIAKNFTYYGKASHAGGGPHKGINAEYAALLGLQAANNLRETFVDDDHIRFHPIMHGVQTAVNIIPDEIHLESYVRGRTIEAIERENRKINRALAGAAVSMGARLVLNDRPGYFPENHDRAFMELVQECCEELSGKERVHFDYQGWGTGSSDFGDLTAVMPGVQFNSCGSTGEAHSVAYRITDPERMCMNSVKAQLFVADALLSDNAEKARKIVRDYHPQYPSIKAYFEAIDRMFMDREAVEYKDDGSIAVHVE